MTPFRGKLRIRHLEIVLLVVEYGNLSKAAQHLHMTQSGLSRAIAEIEDILDGRVFERSSKGMAPTALGIAISRHAQVLMGNFRKAETDLAAIARGELGSITIGCFSMFSGWPMAEACDTFRAAHPKVALSVEIGVHERLVEVLDSGALDVLLSRTSAMISPATYRIIPVMNDPVVLVCSPSHPLARAAEVSLADCVPYPWISGLPASHIRNELASRFRDAGLPEPETLGALSVEFGRDMIQAGPYLWLLPGGVATVMERRGVVHVLPLDLALKREPFAAIWRRDRPSSRQTRAFVSILARVIKSAQV